MVAAVLHLVLQHAAQAALAGGNTDDLVALDDLLPVVERQNLLADGQNLLVHRHRIVEGRLRGKEGRVLGKDGGVQVSALVGVGQVLGLVQVGPLGDGVERHEVGGVGVLALLGKQAVLPQAVGVGDVMVVVHAGASPTHEQTAVREVVAELLALLLVTTGLLSEVGSRKGNAKRHLDVGLGLLGSPVGHEEVEGAVVVGRAHAQTVALHASAQLHVDLGNDSAVGAGVLRGGVDVGPAHGIELVERLSHDAGSGIDRVLGAVGLHAGQLLGQGGACSHDAHGGGAGDKTPARHAFHLRFPFSHTLPCRDFSRRRKYRGRRMICRLPKRPARPFWDMWGKQCEFTWGKLSRCRVLSSILARGRRRDTWQICG